MSNATELLSRADEICSRVWDPKAEELSEEIRAFLAAEPEEEPVYQIAMAEGSTSTAWIDVAKDVFDDAGMYPEYKRRALYTRPEPARKPMTDREIMEQAKAMGFDDISTMDFAIGVRYAEKHHGIGINTSDPDSIDLQSRCRGDKL